MTTTAAALGPVVDALVARPVGDLCVAELQGQLAAVGRQVDRLLGWQSAAAGELQARTGGAVPTDDGGMRTVVSWLAEQRRETSSAVGSAVKTAVALRSLPLVSAAVLDGLLTPGQAGVLARLVDRFDPDALAECEPDLVLVAASRTPAELAAYVRHLIATHCEPALEEEADRAAGRRFLQTSSDGGLLRGRFAVPLADGEQLLTALEPLARRDGLADPRTAGQRRADALTALAEQVLRHGQLPAHGGQRPQVSYVLPADWAARQGEQDRCPSCTSCPEHAPPSLADTVAASLPRHAVVRSIWRPRRVG